MMKMVPEIGGGYYTAAYFRKTQQVLANRITPVTMQVFQKDDSVLYGMTEVVEILRSQSVDGRALKIKALPDGSEIAPWETVMTIEGDLFNFVHLESVYLGILARGTRVATNMRRVVNAANGKPVLFMGDRFDRYENQEQDGAAALIGGAAAICTPAMGKRMGVEAQGTMPHALIAACGGDVVEACRRYLNKFPNGISALVDFNNDCVGDSLRVLAEFGCDLHSVRLDTSEKLVDKSLEHLISGPVSGPRFTPQQLGLTGVNPVLVRKVRNALDTNGGEHVKIVVSGGFTPEKIARFEAEHVPVDVYGVGSSIIKNGPDFTADVVKPVSKVGRQFNDNPRLVEV